MLKCLSGGLLKNLHKLSQKYTSGHARTGKIEKSRKRLPRKKKLKRGGLSAVKVTLTSNVREGPKYQIVVGGTRQIHMYPAC